MGYNTLNRDKKEKEMKKFSFFVFLFFLVWAILYGENLPVTPDTFSEWFSGKFVLGILAGIFFVVFILSFFEKTEKKKPMATPKYNYLKRGKK